MYDPRPSAAYTQYIAPVKPHRSMAITALVCGIVGSVFGLIPLTFLIALAAGLVALVFGIFGRKHGMGKAGIVLGVIAVTLGIVGAVIVNNAATDLSNYGNCLQTAQTLEEQSACN